MVKKDYFFYTKMMELVLFLWGATGTPVLAFLVASAPFDPYLIHTWKCTTCRSLGG